MPEPSRSISVSRIIDAPASQVFAFLAEPANHVRFESSGMIRSAADGAPIGATGDVFLMNMHNDIRGYHQVENHVIVYEQDRAIGWSPASRVSSPPVTRSCGNSPPSAIGALSSAKPTTGQRSLTSTCWIIYQWSTRRS